MILNATDNLQVRKAGLARLWGSSNLFFGKEIGLRSRLLVLLGSILLAVLFISGTILSYFVYMVEQELWRSRVMDETRHVSQDLQFLLNLQEDALKSLAEYGIDEIHAGYSPLDDLLESYPALSEVVFFDSDGRMLERATRGEGLLQAQSANRQSEWFLSARNGQTYTNEMLHSPGRQPCLIYSLPAAGNRVLAARVDVKSLWNGVTETHAIESGLMYLINRQGTVLTDDGQFAAFSNSDIAVIPGLSGLLSSFETEWHNVTIGLLGERALIASSPLEERDWIVVIELPERKAFADRRATILMLLAGLMIAGVLVVILIDRLLNSQVIQPVQLLQQGASQIEHGNLAYRVPIFRRDEIGRVTESFNQMANSLSERDAQLASKTAALEGEVGDRMRAETLLAESNQALRKAHDDLEQRVQERTIQLRMSRDQLTEANRDLQTEVASRQRVEAILRQSESELRALFAAMNEVVIVYNREGRYLKVPSTNTPLLYRPPEEMVGKLVTDVLPHEQASLLLEHINRALDTLQTVSIEYSLEINSQEFVFSGAISPMKEDTVVLVARNITDRKRAEEQLLFDAFHDTLTGLPNRALFQDRLGHAIERNRRHPDILYAVLFLDLDRFKVINDSLGHACGDRLLVSLAGRLSMCLRSADTAARLGGDEFVILLEDLHDSNQALEVAERILEEMKLPFSLEVQRVYVTTSIGIVISPPRLAAYESAEDVLRDADTALYRAKALGRARYTVFDASLRRYAITRLEMESELRAALESGEFQLHYQPIRSLQTNRITGFEALLRWSSPTRGSVSPAEFIPIAEETGLIVPLGEWVLNEACQQLSRWQILFPTDPPLTMNVNISGIQFSNPSLIEKAEEVLRETGLSPQSLKLEITESVFMENAGLATSILGRLDELGVQLQIDDFGTGYSSLAYLHRYPIHTIKIDRSFVSRIGMNGDNVEIVKTIVALARDLGMEAVAEGVETEEQLNQLKALKCQYGQGFFIARPMDAKSIEELLSQRETIH